MRPACCAASYDTALPYRQHALLAIVSGISVIFIPLLEPRLGDSVLFLDAPEERFDLPQRSARREVHTNIFVSQLAVVLDALTRGLHTGDAEGGGGAFEEVSER